MTDVSTPTISSLSSLSFDENNNIKIKSPNIINSPTGPHSNHIHTSEEDRLLLDASTSEDKIRLLRKELLLSLKENKTLILNYTLKNQFNLIINLPLKI